MICKDTHIKDLKLNIAAGPISEEGLDKLVEGTGYCSDVFGNTLRVEVSIIGASHCVSIVNEESGEVIIKEVLASIDMSEVATNSSKHTLYGNDAITGMDEVKYEDDSNGVKYGFSSAIFNLRELQEYRDFISDTMLYKSTQHQDQVDFQHKEPIILKYVFPCEHESDIEAQTLIKVSYVADRILITSYHVYPNNDSAFVSYSEVVLSKLIPTVMGYSIVSQALFVENMEAAGFSREDAVSMLESSTPVDLGTEVLDELKSEVEKVFNLFDEAATSAKEKISKIDTDEVLDGVKASFGNFVDSFKSTKE